MVYAITKRIFWPLIRLFVKSIEGLENLPDGQCIYVFNHHSYLDGFLVPMMVAWYQNKKVYIFATNQKFTGWLWDGLFEHFGAIRIGGSMPKAIEKYKQGYSLALAPEGQRSYLEKTQPVHHTGLGVIALETQALIVPIGLDTYHFWNRFDKLPRFRKNIAITIGRPMKFTYKKSPANFKKVVTLVMKEVDKLARISHTRSTALV
ncbi:1-acyl-sn-glycerol-3-phosphate acyltransferase [Candidatus Woesearchaeota archaeon]|nr:1-acyl-sn-glycerol-3-phosphate acyltransferase [Candidatus Woesearchaeota archaeon]